MLYGGCLIWQKLLGIEEQGWLGPHTLLAYEAFRYGYMLSTDNFIDGYCETYADENQFFLRTLMTSRTL